MDKGIASTWITSVYVVVMHRLLYLNLKLSSEKLSYFSDIWRTCESLMFLLEPMGRGGQPGPLLLFEYSKGRTVQLALCSCSAEPAFFSSPLSVQSEHVQKDDQGCSSSLVSSVVNPQPVPCSHLQQELALCLSWAHRTEAVKQWLTEHDRLN
jgi:hypothetical protein